jgi:hypothetical protein
MEILLFEIGLWDLRACDAHSNIHGALKPVFGLKNVRCVDSAPAI